MKQRITYAIDVDIIDEFENVIDSIRELEFNEYDSAKEKFDKIKKSGEYDGETSISVQLMEVDNRQDSFSTLEIFKQIK